jgi:hypothetical protein
MGKRVTAWLDGASGEQREEITALSERGEVRALQTLLTHPKGPVINAGEITRRGTACHDHTVIVAHIQ